jgi:hypothetical protein
MCGKPRDVRGRDWHAGGYSAEPDRSAQRIGKDKGPCVPSRHRFLDWKMATRSNREAGKELQGAKFDPFRLSTVAQFGGQSDPEVPTRANARVETAFIQCTLPAFP